MVRMVLKEKLISGNVIGGPYNRIRKSYFEKLTIEQRDIIRGVVIFNFQYNVVKSNNGKYFKDVIFHNYLRGFLTTIFKTFLCECFHTYLGA